MSESALHRSHPDIINRLKRAEGHLRSIIAMLEAEKPCAEIAGQIKAVESAITAAKRTLIHDHIDHCLGNGGMDEIAELRAMAKLL
jgi:DNA-binding FrmR family transcriptional regulator